MKARVKIPSPLNIALALTIFVVLATLFITRPEGTGLMAYGGEVLGFWYSGLWGLLAFTMQMVMMLVLGHMLALSPLVSTFVNRVIGAFQNMAWATAAVLVLTIVTALFNWGFGLIFGAIMARKLGEYAAAKGLPFHYPLVTAAGYCGLMVWHGGLSGSAPLSVAKEGHVLVNEIGVISTSETIFSTQNIIASVAVILVLGTYAFWQASRKTSTLEPHWDLLSGKDAKRVAFGKPNKMVVFFGGVMLLLAGTQFWNAWQETGDFFAALNLDFINFLLFGLVLLFLGSVKKVEQALNEAVLSAAAILIQFPLYAGIMAVMRESGMITLLADGFIAVSNAQTYPIWTMLSAACVNLVVPSGGGQWAVQGPVVVEAAKAMNVSIAKCIMALAYGDQLTNMIQPFWALPLLGITKIKAQELLPYTFRFMLLGLLVYGLVLLFW